MKCTFYLRQQHLSASGYFALWETDGIFEELPHDRIRVTVAEGQYVFLDQEQPGEEDEGSSMLVRVPTGDALMSFCEEAKRQAGQAVYDRISGYENDPRFGGGPYDYTNGFDGAWLKSFAVRIWKETDGSRPRTLQDALSSLS
jgi:hypothetical protein